MDKTLGKLKESPVLLFIVIAVASLALVNAFLLLQPVKNPLSVYKSFVGDKHSELLELYAEIKAGMPEEPDTNGIQENYLYLLYGSMVEDVEWFEERQKAIADRTVLAGSLEEARQGFTDIIALELVFQNALLLNGYPAEEGFWEYYEDYYEEEVGEAVDKKHSISASVVLAGYINEELLQQAGINRESVEDSAEEIMAAYIEKRVQEFDSALSSGNRLWAFVEANKVVGLYGLTLDS